ncbi:MAG: methionyl-tRNA formyltransferase [Saprospiraceae bacterium]|nr:methionyl-tRNA formyltransferase [Saprospiraceae bacterium]
MGSPDFAVPSLDILIKNGYDVVAVVTSPDSFGGRGGKQLIQSPIKKFAEAHHIPILQPTNLKSSEFINSLRSFNADLQIVVAFRMLPEVVWNMPPLGTFNLHGSLLPLYRGAAPIHHAVMNGEKITGVTCFKLKHEIDTGDILMQELLDINERDTTGMVHDKMMHLGAKVILESVKLITSGKYSFFRQDDLKATKAPKLFHHTNKIDFDQDIQRVYNFIRGLSPFPGSWCHIDDMEIKILSGTVEENNDDLPPKTIVSDQKKYVKIKCKNGYIQLNTIKPQGKKMMLISQFLNGHKIKSSKTS